MIEIWKSISGFEMLYSISNLGRILNNRNGKIMKLQNNGDGYHHINLSKFNIKKTYQIHRLMGYEFLGNRPEGYQINHKDGNKLNNTIDNLEYVTAKENIEHAWRIGLCTINIGCFKKGHKNIFSPETREKLSLASLGKPKSEEHKRHLRQARQAYLARAAQER